MKQWIERILEAQYITQLRSTVAELESLFAPDIQKRIAKKIPTAIQDIIEERLTPALKAMQSLYMYQDKIFLLTDQNIVLTTYFFLYKLLVQITLAQDSMNQMISLQCSAQLVVSPPPFLPSYKQGLVFCEHLMNYLALQISNNFKKNIGPMEESIKRKATEDMQRLKETAKDDVLILWLRDQQPKALPYDAMRASPSLSNESIEGGSPPPPPSSSISLDDESWRVLASEPSESTIDSQPRALLSTSMPEESSPHTRRQLPQTSRSLPPPSYWSSDYVPFLFAPTAKQAPSPSSSPATRGPAPRHGFQMDSDTI